MLPELIRKASATMLDKQVHIRHEAHPDLHQAELMELDSSNFQGACIQMRVVPIIAILSCDFIHVAKRRPRLKGRRDYYPTVRQRWQSGILVRHLFSVSIPERWLMLSLKQDLDSLPLLWHRPQYSFSVHEAGAESASNDTVAARIFVYWSQNDHGRTSEHHCEHITFSCVVCT